MFNLEKAIVAWRQDLAVAGIHRALALDELESHLRDDVEQRVRTGEQVEEAFRAAVARLGQPAVLQKEFAKVCTTKFRSLRAILRISCFVTAPTMFLAGAWGFWDADTEPLTRAAGLAALCAATTYIALLPFLYRKLPNPDLPGVAIVLKLMSLCFGVLPIIALLDALHVIHLHASFTSVLVGSCAYVIVAFTGLAYVCRDQDLRQASNGGPDDYDYHVLMAAALQTARNQAMSLGHDFVGTEHLLLGIMANRTKLLTKIFHGHGLDENVARLEIMKLVSPQPVNKAKDMPYTPRSTAALNFAALEAQSFGHPCIAVEHLLLGLLHEREGVAGTVLRQHGLRFAKTRAEILRGWSDDDEGSSLVVAS